MNSRFDPDQAAYYKSGMKKSTWTDSSDIQKDEPSFFFYDLETSGISPREDRIMQFAGQRTNLELEPLGEPVNILIKLNNDTLPSPEAIMVTHILPQETVKNGMTEAEFCRIAMNEIILCVLTMNICAICGGEIFMIHMNGSGRMVGAAGIY